MRDEERTSAEDHSARQFRPNAGSRIPKQRDTQFLTAAFCRKSGLNRRLGGDTVSAVSAALSSSLRMRFSTSQKRAQPHSIIAAAEERCV